MDSFVDLDVAGALENSDKSSSVRFAWDYLRHYEALFAPFRDKPINVIEIGVNFGASVRMWQWFFPAAQIVGIDINPDCVAHARPRIAIEIGSQVDFEFLENVCARFPPSIILDDGSHDYGHMVASFEHLMPRLAAGGIYVVEDVAMHIGPGLKMGNGKPNVPEYFLDIARRCFSFGAGRGVHPVPPQIMAMVDRVTVFGQAVALHKRHDVRDVARGAATGEVYASAAGGSGEMWENLAEWLLAHDGANDAALRAADRALAAGPGNIRRQLFRAKALARSGNTEATCAIAERAMAEMPKPPPTLYLLCDVLLMLGEVEKARAVRDVALATPGIAGFTVRRFERLFAG